MVVSCAIFAVFFFVFLFVGKFPAFVKQVQKMRRIFGQAWEILRNAIKIDEEQLSSWSSQGYCCFAMFVFLRS